MRAPAAIPPSSPNHADPSTEANTAAVNAPARNCPSIAMLMTPARSLSTPAMAPNAIGTAAKSAPRNSATSETDASADAQVSIAMTNSPPATPTATGARRPRPRTSCRMPTASTMRVSTTIAGAPGTTKGGRGKRSPRASLRTKVARASPTPRRNRTGITAARASVNTPSLRSRRWAASAITAELLMRPTPGRSGSSPSVPCGHGRSPGRVPVRR